MKCQKCHREYDGTHPLYCITCLVLRLASVEEQLAHESDRFNRFREHLNLIGDAVIGSRSFHTPDSVSRETLKLVQQLRDALQASQVNKDRAQEAYEVLYSQVKDLADTIDHGLGVTTDSPPMGRLASQVAALLKVYVEERLKNESAKA